MSNPLITVNTGPMSGDVFYGSININGTHINVSNLTELGKTYRFRYTAKARAGFPVIGDVECTVEALGKPYWFNILTIKGTKWNSIDKNLLENLEVGDMHRAFPKMIDWNIWKAMNTKFHSCKSFVMNQAA